MTGPDESSQQAPQAAPQEAARPEPEWKRRRRLAEIFGDVEPSVTSDEIDPGERSAARAKESASERWLKSQVPPHHGG
ncbi:hypothetical protein JK386_13260 [Nocardioides sp. zg-536]|uniref:Uncharacterized protein n=1 Tax=Nocardioides faecalis TaxID=2803858 RepID=A0A938Y7Z0_9ACTN|nr:hypothetical protein [Nocardioides faecalis]MBM9460867.1 hypothetical protein [Nocardioides faecalis]MBS4751842.1 hypothetical protein [Nocardioides faecalis]QVI59304.1 hypothetical protein KG111_02705 [Nocardioides faecalis]